MNLFGRIKKAFKNDSSISMSTINEWFFNSASADLGADISEIT